MADRDDGDQGGHDGWRAWARLIQRRPGRVALAALAVTVALGAGLPRLEFRSSQDTMISPASDVYRTNLRYQGAFGGEVMVVLFEGPVGELASGPNRTQLERLAAALEETGRFHAVLDPATVLRFAADQVGVAPELTLNALARDLAAAPDQAARDELNSRFAARAAADATRLAAAGEQTLDNPAFVEFLLFDEDGEVRPSQRGAFPDATHALMPVRLRGNMSIDEQGRAAADVVRLVEQHPVAGFETVATGSAALLKEVNDQMRSDMARTGVLALVVMAVVLLLVHQARWRLLALPMASVSIVWAFGALGYLGIPLTMVTIAGLPILIGLGVDFAVQVHARYEEEAATATQPLAPALVHVGPALGVAMVAAVAGFLALRVSPVPMVQDFGVMLAVGTATLLVGVAVWVPLALVWRDRRGCRPPRPHPRRGIERVVEGLTAGTSAHPAAVLAAVAVIVVGGLVAQREITVESDPERFVPQDSPVLADLRHLRDVAGTSADIGMMVEADDVTRSDILEWMAGYEQRQLAAHPGALVSSSSIATIASAVSGSTPTPEDVGTVLAIAPPALERLFVTEDRTRAQMLFSVGHLSLAEQQRLLESMQADLGAPAGVGVAASGLAVVGIEAVRSLEEGQASTSYTAVLAVLAWILLWSRSLRKTTLVLLPVLTALGAASAAIYLLGLHVSMLGALSSPLVIAVSTEFSILVLERYQEERGHGLPPDLAIATASTRIGRAFTASGLTTAAGFAVLMFSGFPLLSSFGAVVAVNILAAMTCSLVILPPLLRWGDRPAAEAGPAPEALAAGPPVPV